MKGVRAVGRSTACAIVFFALVMLSLTLLLLTASPWLAGATADTSFSRSRAGAAFLPHQVIVQFKSSADSAERAQARAQLDANSVSSLGGANMVLLMLDKSTSVAEAVQNGKVGAAADQIKLIEPDYLSHTTSLPNDPLVASQWYLNNTGQTIAGAPGVAGADIGAIRAWNVNTGDSNVTVAVIDTGIDLSHEDLSSRLWNNPGETGGGKENNGIDDDSDGLIDDWRGWDFTGNDSVPDDTFGHGTQMSGIIGAAGNNSVGISGVGQNLRLMPLRVGTGSSLSNANIVSAINYAAAHGANVVNMSFGSYTHSGGIDVAIGNHPDVLFVAAAGNDGTNDDTTPFYPCVLPHDNIICVAATDNQDQLASFSNYGASSVDVGAPGASILSTSFTGAYNFGDGTSQATAVVSGAAALLKSAQPGYTSADLHDRLLATVDPVSALSTKTITGGRIDVGNATDFVAPHTFITNAPPALSNNTQPSFSFAADESVVTFQCQVDSGSWASCVSGLTLPPQADGDHTFRVRATDGGLNTDPFPASADFTVDTVAPNTSIDSGVNAVEHVSNASFTFSSNKPNGSFQCQLDNQGWTNCPSGNITYNGLSDGSHSFQVSATDQGGNTDQTPASASWTVDASLPVTTINSGPPQLGNSTSANFSFSASEPATFECNLDGQGWNSCSSPTTFFSLAEGAHTLQVRATDTTANVEASPPSYSWTVDLTPASVSLLTTPAASSTNTSPAFTYGSEPGASFQCKLDSQDWSSCPSSGIQYSGVSVGSHSFSVRAFDQAGNPPGTPATFNFQVTAPPVVPGVQPPPPPAPDTSITKKPTKLTLTKLSKAPIAFTFSGGQSYQYQLQVHTRTGWKALKHGDSTATLRLRLRPGKYKITVSAVADGQTDSSPVVYGFTIRKKMP